MEITQAQKYEILEHELLNGAGLEEILKKCLEILMKSEREIHNENYSDYSNGYRYRKIYGSGKLLELQVPRTRNGNFYPMILALLKDQQEEAQRVAYSLYRKGLTTQDVGEVFEELYGKKYSTSQVSRMFDYARKEAEEWLVRPLESYYPILYIDALYASTRRGDSCSKEAYFSVLAVKSDKTREVLGIYNNPHESASFWDEILQNLRDRGVHKVGLVVSDALNGVENAVWRAFPKAEVQLCAIHFQRNLSKSVRTKDRSAFCQDLKTVFQSDPTDSVRDGLRKFSEFCGKWKSKYPWLSSKLQNERLALHFTYLKYNYNIRPMIYTTNWIERLNKTFKKSLKVRGALPNVEAGLILLYGVATEMSCYNYPITAFVHEQQHFRWD